MHQNGAAPKLLGWHPNQKEEMHQLQDRHSQLRVAPFFCSRIHIITLSFCLVPAENHRWRWNEPYARRQSNDVCGSVHLTPWRYALSF